MPPEEGHTGDFVENLDQEVDTDLEVGRHGDDRVLVESGEGGRGGSAVAPEGEVLVGSGEGGRGGSADTAPEGGGLAESGESGRGEGTDALPISTSIVVTENGSGDCILTLTGEDEGQINIVFSPEVVARHSLGVNFARAKYSADSPWVSAGQRLVISFTRDDFQGFLDLLEILTEAGVNKFYTTLRTECAESELRKHRILFGFARLRVLSEGILLENEKLDELDEIENSLAKMLSPEDFFLLLKLAEHGGSFYSALASKFIYSLYYGPEFSGHVSSRLKRNARKMGEATGRLLCSDSEDEQRLGACSLQGMEYTTPAQRVSTCGIVLRRGIVEEPAMLLSDLYEKYFSDFVKYLAVNVVYRYYMVDNEQFPQEAVREFVHVATAAVRYKFADKPGDRASASLTPEEADEVIRLVGEVIIFLHQTAIGSEFEKALLGRGLQSQVEELSAVPEVAVFDRQSFLAFSVDPELERVVVANIESLGSNARSRVNYGEELVRIEEKMEESDSFLDGTGSVQRMGTCGEFECGNTRLLSPEARKMVLLRLIEKADNAYELVRIMEAVAEVKIEEILALSDKDIMVAILDKIRQNQGFIRDFIKAWIPSDAPSNHLGSVFSSQLYILSSANVFAGAHSPLFAGLLHSVLAPDFYTFHKACCILADFFANDVANITDATRPSGFAERPEHVLHFFDTVFADSADFLNPLRIMAVRNIVQRMPEEPRAVFLAKFASHPDFPVDREQNERICRMLGCYADVKFRDVRKKRMAEAERERIRAETKTRAVQARSLAEKQREAPLALLQRLSAEAQTSDLHVRDCGALVREIISKRTTHISHDGDTVSVNSVDSSLAQVFSRARIKRNQKTGNPPEGLACNVTLDSDVNDYSVSVYCRLQPDGSLEIRLLESGAEKGAITRASVGKYGISETFFDELHYFVLMAVRVVYVREEGGISDGAADGSQGHLEVESGAKEPDVPSAYASGVGDANVAIDEPVVAQRHSGIVHIDLTDATIVREADAVRRDRIRIGTNRDKVLQVFRPLVFGQQLPETPPEELLSLHLHYEDPALSCGAGETILRPVEAKDISALYELIRTGDIRLEDVFVRIARAHAKVLPYFQSERYARNDEDDSDYDASRPVRVPYYHVFPKRRSESSRVKERIATQEEGLEAMALSPGRQIIGFDVEERDGDVFFEQLFERMKSREFFEAEVNRRARLIHERIDHLLALAWEKYVAKGKTAADFVRYLNLRTALEKRTESEIERARKNVEEMVRRTHAFVENVYVAGDSGPTRRRVRYRFAQDGYSVNTTFNQGRFQSLKDLLDEARTI